MIPFFRKIRKKMADDNKPMKYMRYAIGEIVLVVIGILIALSINNWNENRKLKTEEIKILRELQADLKQSQKDIQEDQMGFKRQKLSLQIISIHIENRLPYHDSLDSHFSSLDLFYTFSINKSTFDHINNMEGGLISNDALRRSIAKFYTHIVNLYKEFEDRILQEHYTNYLKPMMISEFKSFEINSLKPRNFEDFTKNKNNIQVINYTLVMLKSVIDIQNLLLEELELMDQNIEKELSILK
jgi:hypothetical protein